MPLPSPSDNSPWPVQTTPPSQSRKRRILSHLNNRSLSTRQVFNQTGVRTSSPLLCSHASATTTFPPIHPPLHRYHSTFSIPHLHISLFSHSMLSDQISSYHSRGCSPTMRAFLLKQCKIMFSHL